ncbi:MAG: SWIM zinc finger family protein [Waddliaceae bacterium]
METTALEELSEEKIRRLVEYGTYEEGDRYQSRGAVDNLQRTGTNIRGRVHGSRYKPYLVQCDFPSNNKSNYSCSCPSYRFPCKHIIAVLLEYVRNGVGEHLDSIDTLLDKADSSLLRKILRNLIDSNPDIAGTVQLALMTPEVASEAAPDIAVIKRRIESLLSNFENDYCQTDGWHKSYDDVESDLIEGIDELLAVSQQYINAGQGLESVYILQAITERIAEEISMLSEYGDFASNILQKMEAPWTEACLCCAWPSNQQKEVQKIIDDFLSDAGDDELQELLTRIDQIFKNGWKCPILEAAISPDSSASCLDEMTISSQLFQAAHRILIRQDENAQALKLSLLAQCWYQYALDLVEAGQHNEAVKITTSKITDAFECQKIAQILYDHQALSEALATARYGAQLPSKYGFRVPSLLQLAQTIAKELGQDESCIEISLELFERQPNLKNYKKLKEAASKDWEAACSKVRFTLQDSRPSTDIIEICLEEQWIPEALQAAKNLETFHFEREGSKTLLRLIPHEPIWVFETCVEIAKGRIGGKCYEDAGEWLEYARQAALAANSIPKWEHCVDSIMDEHRRKYKLMPILKTLRVLKRDS